jgi:hypothetical protein
MDATREPMFKVGDIVTKNPKTQDECRNEWSKLRIEMLGKINAIDQDTPWSEKEPEWWAEMEHMRKLLRISMANHAEMR